MFWIEAQSTAVIALFVFSLTYVLAATAFCLAATLSRRSVAQDLKVIIPVTLTTPLGVVLGLLILCRRGDRIADSLAAIAHSRLRHWADRPACPL
jgi:hypothetical protein